jgi:tetratricopeptide (TPR) repeat protein
MSASVQPASPSQAALALDFPMHGLPLSRLWRLINDNGGDAAFEGLTTSDVKRNFIVPMTQASKLSLCEQMRQEGDMCAGVATWFVSHAWQNKFLDLVRALDLFFKHQTDVVLWLDLVSTSQHATFDKPPEWWQGTFQKAIGCMGQMVMVLSPWHNPLPLKRAWCLMELYACRSSGSRFDIALPPLEKARFLDDIVHDSGAFYAMLANVNTAKSDCSRDSDKQRIFAAVRSLPGGFVGLDRGVLATMTDWLKLQLQDEVQVAAANGRTERELDALRALGSLFNDNGEYCRALAIWEECLVKGKLALGDDHPDVLGTLNNIANCLDDKGEHDRALLILEECLERRKKAIGDDHPDVLDTLQSMAQILLKKGHVDRALLINEECLEKRRTALGDDHPDVLSLLSNVAACLASKKEHGRALLINEECLEKRSRVLGPNHPDVLASLQNTAICLERMGQSDRSLRMEEQCLEFGKRVLGDDHPDVLDILQNHACSLARNGANDRALLMYEECLEKRRLQQNDDHIFMLDLLSNLSRCLETKGDFGRALLIDEECLERRRRVLGDDHPDVLQSLFNTASLLVCNGKYHRALLMFEECLERRRRVLGDDHPDVFHTLINVALGLQNNGSCDRALPMFEHCVEKGKRLFGHDHPDTKNARLLLRKCAAAVTALAQVNSAMWLIDVTLAPPQCMDGAKRSVFERLAGM